MSKSLFGANSAALIHYTSRRPTDHNIRVPAADVLVERNLALHIVLSRLAQFI